MLTPDDPMKTHPRPEPARRRALGGGVIAAAAALTLLLPALPAAAIAPMAHPASLPATER